MREIEFRGKSKKSKQWVYGVPIKVGLSNCVVMCSSGNSLVNNLLTNPPQSIEWVEIKKNEVIPETVGQYTGLKDKNDIEIYEGDIVIYNNKLHTVIFDEENATFSVRKKYTSWDFVEALWGIDVVNELEVVGNIYDNPELIEKEVD